MRASRTLTPSVASTSPDLTASRSVSGSAMVLNSTLRSAGLLPQYDSLRSRTTPEVSENFATLKGPVPIVPTSGLPRSWGCASASLRGVTCQAIADMARKAGFGRFSVTLTWPSPTASTCLTVVK
ncbi:hypothetical protein GCM10020219_032650 [Nonomuraea dietziae]